MTSVVECLRARLLEGVLVGPKLKTVGTASCLSLNLASDGEKKQLSRKCLAQILAL